MAIRRFEASFLAFVKELGSLRELLEGEDAGKATEIDRTIAALRVSCWISRTRREDFRAAAEGRRRFDFVA